MAAARRARPAGSALGFRHVRYVVLHRGDGGVRAEVVGIAHRAPRRVTVPLSLAARLAADGVPVVTMR